MNFDEFVKEMQENIKAYLPEWYENATVDVFQNLKLNDPGASSEIAGTEYRTMYQSGCHV